VAPVTTDSAVVQWRISHRMEAFRPGIYHEIGWRVHQSDEWTTVRADEIIKPSAQHQ